MKNLLTNIAISFLVALSIVFVVYENNEKNKAFDSLESKLLENKKLLSEYRIQLDTLHYSMYQTHLPEEF